QVSPDATLDYYVRFDINGDTGDWLNLAGLHLGASAPSLIGGSGGGAGAGKVSFDAVQMTLGTSATVLALTEALAAGQKVDAQVEAYAPSSKGGVLVDEYQFDTAFLAKLSTQASPDQTSNEVSLEFGKITHTHLEQDATGKIGDSATVTYDVLKNTTNTSDVSATADAIKHLPTADAPVDAQLQYYVTYEGAPGWLELSGFSMDLSSPITIGGATGGAGAGKVSLGETQLELGMSNEIVQLLANLAEGHSIKYLEVEAYSQGAKAPQLVDEYYFDTVFLNSLQTDGAANTLGIDAGKVSHGHVDYSPSGAVSGTSAEGWDFTANRSWTAPGAPDADAAKIVPLSQVSPDATLDYYVRFDINGDTGDWLNLAGLHLGASAPSLIGGSGGGA
ncbi:MAG TPA: type VI secretion system tube protein Hcp, partial [Candidatus Dormibacteraeota bacterium]|nr:type VI secretion system tube protein Hcp [Candidatus Dormibacteraeota bacterium]